MENQDKFTEVTSESWVSRIIGSIMRVILGIILFLLAFVVLWFNEGRAVKTAKGLEEGASQVISVSAQELKDNNEGKLVHVTGKVSTKETLTDPEFVVKVQAIKLRRNVFMYQWVEKQEKKQEKELGGSVKTTTVYKYIKDWNESIVNSKEFKIKDGHTNPGSCPYSGYTHTVSDAKIGVFNLSNSILSNLNSFEPYSVSSIDTIKYKGAVLFNEGSANSGSGGTLTRRILIGKGSSSSPEVGDLKISFDVVKADNQYSIVSKQVRNTFEPYITSTGSSVELVSKGVLSAENMFVSAQKSNTILTWILRLVGFLMMSLGLSMIFKPLVILADILPLLGSIVDFGLSLFSGLIAFGFSFITIAIAWIVYRPVVGITLLIVGASTSIYIFSRKSKKKGSKG